MPRKNRFFPSRPEGTVIELCSKTQHGIHLFTPTPQFVDIAAGCLGRALDIAPVELCGISMPSNHWHGLAVARDHLELSRFVGHFQGNLSKEITRLLDWPGTVFPRRFTAITLSDEPEVQWARLKYILRQTVKERLVKSPLDWEGLHAARPLVEGGYLEGHWYNRTEEFKARARGETFEKHDYATKYQVHFAQLPAFRHLSEVEYRQKVSDLVEEIVEEERVARKGRPVRGMVAVRMQSPLYRPKPAQRSPAPRFLAATRDGYLGLVSEYSAFMVNYRAAAKALKSAGLGSSLGFPDGSFPPAMAFVGAISETSLPLPPPTREIVRDDNGEVVFRGAIPVVEVPTLEVAIRAQPPPNPTDSAQIN